MKVLRTSTWPRSAAQCSAVQPSASSRESTATPAASAAVTPSTSPSLAMICRLPASWKPGPHKKVVLAAWTSHFRTGLAASLSE